MILRRLRIILSILIFSGFLYLFFSYGKLSSPIGDSLGYFQFIPSIINFFSNNFNIIGTGFIVVILATLLFGRIYCSVLCPLGIFQDIIIFITKKSRKNFKHIKSYNSFRYTILFLAILLGVAGLFSLLTFLDPYSIFGRIMTNIFIPIRSLFGNKVLDILKENRIYLNYSFKIHEIETLIFMSSLFFFVLIVIISIIKGRVYCNIVCPVGIFLGVLSRFSLFNIILDKKKCISCMLCEKECKSGCIDAKDKKLDTSRCISCFNCLDLCPSDALSYKSRINPFITEEDLSKREFIKSLLLSSFIILAAPGFFLRRKIVKNSNLIDASLITPPGSIGIKHFTSACTGCHLCVSSCPTKVIVPSFVGYGVNGLLQPRMNYSVAFCDYECTICSRVCPNGAIKPIRLDRKKRTQIGVTNLVKERCIVYDKHQNCGACAEHCPTKAVYMVPYEDLYGPETNTDICIGCGACENVCPAVPQKAIIVKSNEIHKFLSVNPEKIEENSLPLKTKEKNETSDFPF